MIWAKIDSNSAAPKLINRKEPQVQNEIFSKAEGSRTKEVTLWKNCDGHCKVTFL